MQAAWGRSLIREDPHALEQLNPCTTAIEPVLQSSQAAITEAHIRPVLRNKRKHHGDKPAHHSEERPRLPQLEKACSQQWRTCIARNKQINLKKKKKKNAIENVAYTTDIYFCQFWRLGNPRSRCQLNWCLLSAQFLILEGVPSSAQRVENRKIISLMSLLRRALIPSQRASLVAQW